ncbi:MAG: AAA family ATPase [Candidatus Saccharimonas sp.]|nr:AAA family ATPase [Candidatus Saccharimonas sp.]
MDTCPRNSECRQFCQILDLLEGKVTTKNDECSRLENEQYYDPNSVTNPELAGRIADKLRQTVELAEVIEDNLAEKTSDLAVAHEVLGGVFATRMELWQQYVQACRQDRRLTGLEVDYYAEQLVDATETASKLIKSKGIASETLTYAQAMVDRQAIDTYGLMFDPDMCRTVTTLFADVNTGQSVLIIGDKGIAKTQVAKFVSASFSPDGKPRFISGDGSVMKDEFIGKTVLTEKNGASVTEFRPGILAECMRDGIPLIIDEINLIDPAIAMRLQDILLRKPGDVVIFQEDDTATPITIKRGFTIIATANEASDRYQSRAVLDPAFRDRFDVMQVNYPDGVVPIVLRDPKHGKKVPQPSTLMRLAYANIISPSGIKNDRISIDDAAWLVKISHASQQMYSKPSCDINGSLPGSASAKFVDQEQPPMKDCITPRKLVDIIKRVAGGLNPYDIEQGIRGVVLDTVAGMQHRSDRQMMFDLMLMMTDPAKIAFDEGAVKKALKI